MQLPREVIIGSGVLKLVGENCRRLGFSDSALIVTGPRVYDIAAKTAIESLSKEDFSVDVVIVHESTMDYVRLVEDKIKEIKPTVVLGVGGGKDIDVAKLSSTNMGIPFISVPTTASHDGIASPYASIKGLGKPHSIKAQAPVEIIADVDLIYKSPYRLIASGCGDIISKYTAVRDWKLAHKVKNEYYGDYAANLALMSAKLLMRNTQAIQSLSEEGIRTVVEALISCGVAMSIAGSTRPCSGSEHMFSHALDIVAPKPALHGEQCGIGTIMFAYLHGANWKLIKSVLKKVRAPTTSKEIEIEPKYIVEALTISHKIRPERYTILGETGLTKDAAERLAKATGVID
jgi:glycerol-1-phosphate dehydrogenase [NAD(P)+]